MRLYSVFLRNHGRGTDGDIVLVKEGFSWPAFLFTILWALVGRMWLVALGLLFYFAAVSVATIALNIGEPGSTIIIVAASLIVGWAGNDLRRWSLTRGEYDQVAVVTGRNMQEATRRFLDSADISPSGVYV